MRLHCHASGMRRGLSVMHVIHGHLPEVCHGHVALLDMWLIARLWLPFLLYPLLHPYLPYVSSIHCREALYTAQRVLKHCFSPIVIIVHVPVHPNLQTRI